MKISATVQISEVELRVRRCAAVLTAINSQSNYCDLGQFGEGLAVSKKKGRAYGG